MTARATHLIPLLMTSALFAGCATPAKPPTVAVAAPASSLHALFEASWEANMQRHPGWATYVGDHRWGDKLEDGSAEAEAQAYADRRSQRAQALGEIGRASCRERV